MKIERNKIEENKFSIIFYGEIDKTRQKTWDYQVWVEAEDLQTHLHEARSNWFVQHVFLVYPLSSLHFAFFFLLSFSLFFEYPPPTRDKIYPDDPAPSECWACQTRTGDVFHVGCCPRRKRPWKWISHLCCLQLPSSSVFHLFLCFRMSDKEHF